MAKVEILDAMNCLIDGMPAGQPVDCIANHPKIASDIQLALVAWQERQRVAREAELQAVRDGYEKSLAEAHAERDALGTKPESQAILKARRRAEIERQRRQLEEELASLEGVDGR